MDLFSCSRLRRCNRPATIVGRLLGQLPHQDFAYVRPDPNTPRGRADLYGKVLKVLGGGEGRGFSCPLILSKLGASLQPWEGPVPNLSDRLEEKQLISEPLKCLPSFFFAFVCRKSSVL